MKQRISIHFGKVLFTFAIYFGLMSSSKAADTNVALNKTVYVSSVQSTTYDAAYAVDGLTNTRWASAISDPQWIYVDLGTTYNISSVILRWETAYGKAYQIQVSSDASIWTSIYSTTTGVGGVEQINFTTTSARYVRMNGTTRGTIYGYSLYEFEVYGTLSAVDTQAPSVPAGLTSVDITQTDFTLSWNASTDDVGVTGYDIYRNGTLYKTVSTTSTTISGLTPGTTYALAVMAKDAAGNISAASTAFNVTTLPASTNIALNKTVTVSSFQSTTYTGSYAVDGFTNTRWASDVSDPQWIYVDLASTYNVGIVTLRWETAYAKAYQIQVSSDASTWTTVYSTTTGNGGVDQIIITPTAARYIRMYGTTRGTIYGYSLYEFEVYGTPAGPSAPSALTASGVSATQVNLSWADNSNNEDGFRIERKTGSGSFAEIATVAANITTYNNTGLNAGANYSYQVRAYNSTGNSDYTSAASVTLPLATTITVQPANSTQCEGTNATFNVTATGTSLTYQWRKGGTNISGATSSTYTISNIANGDAASYDVVVSGSGGLVTSTGASLTIQTKPVIGTQPVSLTQVAVTSATFSVSATGTNLTYQWRKGGSDISGATSSTYTMNSITSGDAASYDVVVSGTCSPSVISTAATLTVQPLIRDAFSTIQAESLDAQNGLTVYGTGFGNFGVGTWARYDNVNFGAGASSVGVSIGVLQYWRQRMELRLDSLNGTLIGTLIPSVTGGWGNYVEQTTSINGATGIHTLYLVAMVGGVGNLDWFRFYSSPVAPANLVTTAISTTQVNLSWTDNSNNENGFYIERKASTESSFTQIASVAANITTYYNTSLSPGTTYSYRVIDYNAGGNSPYSNEVVVTLPVVPSAPTNLTATAISGSQVNLSWADNSTNEDGFMIERNSGNGFVELGSTGANVTVFNSTGLMAGIPYTYRVKAYSAMGASIYSNEVVVTPPTLPLAPDALSAVPVSGSQIDLSWNDNANNEDGFKIERNSGAGFVEIAQVGSNVIVYSNTGLTFGANYTYRVLAYNVAGKSAYSSDVTAISAVAPSAPSKLVATVLSGTQTNLSWTDNASNEDGFKIERNDGNGFAEIAIVGANVIAYNNTGLTPGGNYSYRVRAYNVGGTSAYTNETSVTSPTKPASPSNLLATTISGTEVKLLWTDNSTNEAGFKIERRNNTINFVEIATLGTDNTSYIDANVVSGTPYTYRIRTFNSTGSSEYSNETTPVTAPLVPFNFYVVNEVSLYPSMYWQTLNINDDGFKIERKDNTSDFIEIATVGSSIRGYTDNTTVSGKSYTYRVRAYNIAGYSAYSNEDKTVPQAPTALIAQVSGPTQISLTWTDNSNTENGFYVQRRTGSGSYSTIASLSSNITYYTDASVTSGLTYTYKVQAKGLRGYSDFSNEVSASPQVSSLNIPIAPSSLKILAQTSTYLYLFWTDNSTNEDGFKIERRTENGNYEEVATIAGVHYINDNLNPDVNYYYRVRAYNSAGYSFYSNEIFVCSVMPASPTILNANFDLANSRVILSWKDNCTNEDGFVIQHKIDSQTDFSDLVYLPANTTNYNDLNIIKDNTPATTITYRISAYYNTKNGSRIFNYSNALTATRTISSPTAPTALTASVISGSLVNLKWVDMSSNEDGFKIERKSGTGDYSLIATLGANVTSYSNTGLDPGATYTYRVSAFNSSINQLSPSNEVTVTLPSVPLAPEVLSSTVISGSQINLSWIDRSNNEDGFRIERKTTSGSYVEIANVGTNVTSFSNVGLTGGTNYTYRVCAYNAQGNSPYTNEAVNDPLTLPLAPSGLATSVISGTQINLSWIDNSSNEDGFSVERNDGNGFFEVAKVGANIAFYNNTGLTAGSNYVYRVRAYDAAGNSAYSNEVSVTSVLPPSDPSGLAAAIASGTQINLSWADNSSNEDGFRIERNDGSGFAEIATVGANVKAFNNTGLTAGISYSYRVRAYNSGGTSAYTNEVIATPPTVPIAPSGLVTTLLQGLKINLVWVDNATNEDGFMIERAIGGGSFSTIATVGPNITTYTNENKYIDLTPFGSYTYRIRAYNKGGYSSILTGTAVTVIPTPSAPILKYNHQLMANSIELSWVNSADYVDGYKIERKMGNGSYSEIASLNIYQSNYDDYGLVPGATYTYRIRSYNASGYSVYSNEIVLTLSNPPDAPTLLKAVSSGPTQVNLTWNDNSNNEESFFVYRLTGTGNYGVIAYLKPNTTSYADIGLTSGVTYTYKVESVISPMGSFSNEASATPGATDISAPTNLVITAPSATQKQLTWTDNSSNEDGFTIEKRTFTGTFSAIGTVGANVNSFTDNAVDSKTIYFYRVTAFNSTAKSGATNEIEAPTPVPAAPTGLTARFVSASTVKLLWMDNSDNESRFVINRSTNSNTGDASANQTFFFDSDISTGTSFTYQVCAYNNTGSYSGCSNQVTITKPTSIPAMPASFTATSISSSEIKLTWVNKATNEEGISISSYNYSSGTLTEIANLAPGATSYTHTGLTAGKTYLYRILAYNYIGSSNNTSTSTTIPGPIMAPSNLAAVTNGCSAITLTWTDNATNETGFKIERRAETGDFIEIATVATDVKTFSDVTIAAGTNYTYRIRAYYSIGSSDYSNEAGVISISPKAPGILAASIASGTQINLAWIDNANNETGYRVERRIGAGSYAEIAVLGPNETVYANPGLTTGTSYTYRVRAFNTTCTSDYSNEVTITPVTLPAAPTDVKATAASGSQVDLSWKDNANNEDGFKIERNSGSGYIEIAAVPANITTYSNTGLTPDVSCTYRVRAYNAAGTSIYSNEATATPPSGVPNAPIDLSVFVISATQINLSWTDKANNEVGFKIEQKTGAGSYTEIATLDCNVTTFNNTGLTEGTSYTYRVRAYNIIGNSVYSSEMTATPLAIPNAPSGLKTYSFSTTTVDLSWNDHSNVEDGFKIERREGTGNFVEVASVLPNVTSYKNTGLTTNTAYTYRVYSFNVKGNSEYSNESGVTPLSLPIAPSNVNALVLPGHNIKLTWTDSDNESVYFIEINGTQAYISQLNTTSYLVTNLPEGNYKFRIIAYNSSGTTASNEVAVDMPKGPSAPKALVATPVSAGQIDLAWTNTSVNHSDNVIERRTDSGDFQVIATLNCASSTYSDQTVQAGTNYVYRVYASDTRYGYSYYSNEAVPGSTTPNAPTALTANPLEGNQIQLSWTDNANNEDGFKIEAQINSNLFTEIGTVPANTTTFIHSGLTLYNTYYYRVRAYNAANSDYSNTVSAMARGVVGAPVLSVTSIACNKATLTWTYSGSNVKGYIINRAAATGDYSFIADADGTSTTYTDAGLTGAQYKYEIMAFGNSGDHTDYSNEATANAQPPSAPTLLTATAGQGGYVDLTWKDNSCDEDGFIIEQHLGTESYAEIATVGVNATSYSNYGLTLGNKYTYRVRAFNKGGNSGYTNEQIIDWTSSISLYTSATQMNSVESVSYDARGQITSQSIAYSDLLGGGTQSQSRIISKNSVMVKQTIYDALGRPAISTLAAPVAQQNLNYVTDFITNSAGTEFNYTNVDRREPPTGKLPQYYSNSNTIEPYAPSSGIPYTQVGFSKLNPGVARASTLAGGAHYLGSGAESLTFTMAVPESELKYFVTGVFDGLTDVILETKGVTKTIKIDADRNTSIVYASADGKQICACYADNSASVQSVTAPFTTENGYCDLHLNVADNVIISNGTCKVYNLANDLKLGEYTGTVNLGPGYYRFEYEGIPPDGTTLSYHIYYKGHSFNFYDNAGRSIFSLSPKGYVEWKDPHNTDRSYSNMKKYASYNEYNSLGWLVSSSSPDEGLTTYRYAADGRIRFSQNAQQLLYGKFSYTNYDNTNRSVESGECTGIFADADVTAPITNNISQWTRTSYDYPADTVTCSQLPQNYTMGRVAKTSTVNDSTYYSYTYDGKVEWVVQKIAGLGRKTIEYNYDDDITGRVSKVIYQHGGTDEFTHHYSYDGDGRLEYVLTKKHNDTNEKLQARYIYCAHGPLKRMELGGNLQGIDYLYNINGWLKSINHPDLTIYDPGADGYAGSAHSNFKPDVFGMELDYYNSDFICRTGQFFPYVYGYDKYNGSITGTRWSTKTGNSSETKTGAYKYVYNNRGFLTQAKFGIVDFSLFSHTTAFDEIITGYDENGNIKGLNRYAGQRIDSLTYNPQGNHTNQLRSVTDDEHQTAITTDIKTQPEKNYLYNAIGQQYWNESEQQFFTYDVYGHVTGIYTDSVNFTQATQKALYTYNDKGFRIKKEAGDKTTWYVRDAAGQILAIYEGTTPKLSEVSLYGAARIGLAQANETTGVIERYVYELTDHLGNVRATIASNTRGGLDVLSYTDYYPFGMVMPGRNYINGKADRFGYQGQYAEKDESGYNHFEARDYDSRIGRWLVPDLAGQYHSPYLGMGNNPVSGVDPDGRKNLDDYDIYANGKITRKQTSDPFDRFYFHPFNDDYTELIGLFYKRPDGMIFINGDGKCFKNLNTSGSMFVDPQVFAGILGAGMEFYETTGMKIGITQLNKSDGTHSGVSANYGCGDILYATKNGKNETVYVYQKNFNKETSQFLANEFKKFGFNKFSILTENKSNSGPELKNTYFVDGWSTSENRRIYHHQHHMHLQRYNKDQITNTTEDVPRTINKPLIIYMPKR